ncbi:MAG: HAMP domain-containing histidine kinase [Candidatus Melainabacteria bacterium]|nr:HAMP domain-containing histidine kinase [Candidatus Melainabacteria bacterium]
MGSTSTIHGVPAGSTDLKIVGIEQARRKKRRIPEQSGSRSDVSYPYVCAAWVENSIPCTIRGVGLNAPVLSVIYPGTAERRKRRQFFYELDRLVRVETVNGDDPVIFERDPLTGAWFMVAGGIKARMPGAVRVSSDGILHVQADGRGLCREEHPDGSVVLNESCQDCTAGDIGMLSMVGHDLRSPLMSVQGLLTLLSSGALGQISEKARDRITGVEADLSRLIRLINDLLDAEMQASGRRHMRFETLSVRELFDAVSWALSGLADMSRIELVTAESELELLADADSLIRVLVNITANAIKHSGPGSRVCLSAQDRDGMVEIKVQDSGTGIKTGDQERIFQLWQRGDGEGSTEGWGLGLAIAKSIVEAHGGTIGCTGRQSGGCTFFVRVPREELSRTGSQEEPGEISTLNQAV